MALNSVDAEPGSGSCRQLRGVSGGRFAVLFGYAEGPPAVVHVSTACHPSAHNGLLQGHLDDAVKARLLRLAPPA